MITVGSIVSLDGSKYKVYEVATYDGVTIPYKLAGIDSYGREGSIVTDRYNVWKRYKWKLESEPPPPLDKKTLICNKIKYLDEKFKKAQAEKKANRPDLVFDDPSYTDYQADMARRLREYLARATTPTSFTTAPVSGTSGTAQDYRHIRGR